MVNMQPPLPVGRAPSRPVVVLGAGASHEAGIPLMQSIVDDFAKELAEAERSEFTAFLDNLMPAAADGVVDLELVLAALDRIPNLATDLTAILLKATGAAHEERLRPLTNIGPRLRDYLRRRVCDGITPDCVRYLRPLLMFARQFGTLDAFTLNYDATIEMLTESDRMPWTDGFGNAWDPGLLAKVQGDSDDPHVRIFKLHGSITWYQRSEYRYLRIPVLPSARLSYFDHEPLQEAMIYPATEKVIQASLYSQLFQYFSTALAETTVALFIGYSCRDASVMALLDEALVRNRRLFVLLVNPDADALRDKVIAMRDIRERCLAIPSWAGAALAADRLLNTVNTILQAQQSLETAEAAKPAQFGAAKRSYRQAIYLYNQIGHVDGIRSIVALDETSNPFTSGQQMDMHLPPDLAGCVWFGLTTTQARESWWLMTAYLLHWFEQDIRNVRNFDVTEHQPPERMMAQVATALHPDSIALSRDLLNAAVAELHGSRSIVKHYLEQLSQQLGWLVGLRFAGDDPANPAAEFRTYNDSPACHAAIALARAANFPDIQLGGWQSKVFPLTFR